MQSIVDFNNANSMLRNKTFTGILALYAQNAKICTKGLPRNKSDAVTKCH